MSNDYFYDIKFIIFWEKGDQMMLNGFTAGQMRAARALLGWTRERLSELSGVSEPTIQRMETGAIQPRARTYKRIEETFNRFDVEFTKEDGVKRKSDQIIKLSGVKDFLFFMDCIYSEATRTHSLDGTKPICVCNLDNSLFRRYMGSHHAQHVERLRKLPSLQIKSLAVKQDKGHVQTATYLVYRYLKDLKSVVTPFYVFGDNLALINFDAANPPEIIMVRSSALANSYRDQFSVMWKMASSIP